MQTSHTNRRSQTEPRHGASNNAVIVTLILTLAVGYFGCVKPMSDQLRSMRLSMTCLQGRVAKLVGESKSAEQGAGLLAQLAEQRQIADQARAALDEIEALNRRLATQTRQIALLATSEDLAKQTARRITEHRELLGAAEAALGEAKRVENKLILANRSVATATTAADRMQALCNKMVSSRMMVEDAHAASDDFNTLQQRLILSSRSTPQAIAAAERLAGLSERLALATDNTPQAIDRITQLESLQQRLISGSEQAALASQSLEVLTDLRNDVIAAAPQFKNLREIVLEVVLMQPAVDRAVATLTPLRQLATIRHLDLGKLDVAMKAVEPDQPTPTVH